MNPTDQQATPGVSEEIKDFLRQQGLTTEPRLVPLPGGANNRVHRVLREEGDWVLKCFYRNPNDSRNRFGAERAFYEWLASRGVLQTPQPLAWCAENRLALFTMLPGRKLQPREVTGERVREAMDFVRSLNESRALQEAQRLPLASEACFSLGSHLDSVDRRLANLREIETASAEDVAAASFIKEELAPTWQRIREGIARSATEAGVPLAAPLPQAQRCLSPSDFGFHNALLGPDGQLRFFDFEYAGWDDPAKLACDFFCQPELPPGHDQWQGFVEVLRATLSVDSQYPVRCRLLWPAYQIKWCCILLNEFVRADSARRAFAAGREPSANRKALQLGKARLALAKVIAMWTSGCHSF